MNACEPAALGVPELGREAGYSLCSASDSAVAMLRTGQGKVGLWCRVRPAVRRLPRSQRLLLLLKSFVCVCV